MNQFSNITSRDNQKIKFARSVREGREKNWIFVEGIRLSEEIFKTNLFVKNVFVSEKFLQNPRTQALINNFFSKSIEISIISEKNFEFLSDTKTPQGIICIAEKPQTGKLVIENKLSSNPFFIILHQINNPTNVGAILRTAEAVNVDGVISTRGTADIFSPKTLRAGMGANLRLSFWTNAEFFEILEWGKQFGLYSVSADIRGNKTYFEFDWKLPTLLIFGSEGHGLSQEEILKVDDSLVIPMANQVESLNVAVASGIILYEAKRQRNSG